MTISEQAYAAGQEVAAAPGTISIAPLYNAALGQFVGWPYRIAPGCIADGDGHKTESFASVIYAERDGSAARDPERPVPADNAAAVIDVHECLDLEGFAPPTPASPTPKTSRRCPRPTSLEHQTTITLGIIYAHSGPCRWRGSLRSSSC